MSKEVQDSMLNLAAKNQTTDRANRSGADLSRAMLAAQAGLTEAQAAAHSGPRLIQLAAANLKASFSGVYN